MDPKAQSFFEALLNTPGVSGYEHTVQAVVREYCADFAHEVTTDLHGNVIACVNPGADVRVMFAGHCDQLGLLVSHVDEAGFVYFQTVGGWDPQQLVGQHVTIWTASGPVPGIISRKAIHLLTTDERRKVVEAKELWIDIGATSQHDAESLVGIGDSVTPELGFRTLRNGIVTGAAMDNRTGVWVVMEALRRAAAKGVECALYSVSTVQEELGKRGAITSAFGIDPHLGVAVDVTHATDCPTIDKKQRGTVNLGGGPVLLRGPAVNPKVGERLAQLATENDIPYQVAALGRAAANDASVMQTTRGGVAVGLVQIPNRYMHSPVEAIALSDLDHAANLLAAFAAGVGNAADYTP